MKVPGNADSAAAETDPTLRVGLFPAEADPILRVGAVGSPSGGGCFSFMIIDFAESVAVYEASSRGPLRATQRDT